MGSSKLITCFAFLMCMAFVYPIKLFLSQPMSILAFTLSVFSLISSVEERVRDCVGFDGWLGLNHNRKSSYF